MLDFRFPKPKDRHAAFTHVGVLRSIQGDTLHLSLVKHRELGWVRVPVIAVELDDRVTTRNEGIDAKLASDKVLRQILDTYGIKNRIAPALVAVCFTTRLLGVHPNQHLASFGISVPARDRAILDVVVFMPRRGPLERLPASNTNVRRFFPTLPSCSTVVSAKSSGGVDWSKLASAPFAETLVSRPCFSTIRGTLTRAVRFSATAALRPKQFATSLALLLRVSACDSLAFLRAMLSFSNMGFFHVELFSTNKTGDDHAAFEV